ncbi:MAG: glycosyltransferase [Myxococcota bacterium]|nr:glycosyltransferase [Myxococcota bacterium]
MKRISLCMIVRDEEQFLPDCLASVRGLVDEIVVVDTGSSDRTMQIAAEAGAIVVSHEWREDFSEARNVALDISTGDWVLSLDADERVSEASRDIIRQAVERPTAPCGLLRMVHATRVDATIEEVLDGTALFQEPVWLARLFLATPDLRWQGRVHEHVNPWLEARGGLAMVLDADIVHLGAVPSVRENFGKDERNLRLLRLEVESNPDSWSARSCLAETLHMIEGIETARDHAEMAWSQVRDEVLPSMDSVPGGVVKAFTSHVLILIKDGRWDAALGEVRAARGLGVAHPNLDYLEGVARENLALREPHERGNHLVRAMRAYEQALTFAGKPVTDSVLSGATTWNSRYRMGMVSLQQHDFQRAERILKEAALLAPESEEIVMAIAEALIGLDRPTEALGCLEVLLVEEQRAADPWLLAADAHRQLGHAQMFEVCLNHAYSRVRARLLGLHRLERLNSLLEWSAAS